MSIYSGFATRQQESTYNQLLYYMCLMLQAKVSNTIEGIPFDDIGLEMKFSKIYKRMHIMEKTKYLPPKFSQCFTKLAHTLGISSKSHIKKYVIPNPNYDNSDMKSIFNDMNDFEAQSYLDDKTVNRTLADSRSEHQSRMATKHFPQNGKSPQKPIYKHKIEVEVEENRSKERKKIGIEKKVENKVQMAKI